MKKLISAIALATGLALAGPAAADCCHGQDINLSMHGSPYYGKWAMINDRPYVGVESFASSLGLPRVRYYQGWAIAEEPPTNLDPLNLAVMVDDEQIDTVRFGGVTMIDLYDAARALDLPVHHNFASKTIQIGSNYHGEAMKGERYRQWNRNRGWYHEHHFFPRVYYRYRDNF